MKTSEELEFLSMLARNRKTERKGAPRHPSHSRLAKDLHKKQHAAIDSDLVMDLLKLTKHAS